MRRHTYLIFRDVGLGFFLRLDNCLKVNVSTFTFYLSMLFCIIRSTSAISSALIKLFEIAALEISNTIYKEILTQNSGNLKNCSTKQKFEVADVDCVKYFIK